MNPLRYFSHLVPRPNNGNGSGALNGDRLNGSRNGTVVGPLPEPIEALQMVAAESGVLIRLMADSGEGITVPFDGAELARRAALDAPRPRRRRRRARHDE